MKLQQTLSAPVEAAFKQCGIGDHPIVLQPSSKAEFGDYQINGVMGAAKKNKMNPRELAQKVVDALELNDIASKVEIAGPGFINIHLAPEYVAAHAAHALSCERLSVAKQEPSLNIPIDYPSANLAKEMHVGHLRSSIIGDALNRVLRFFGHNAFCQDHVGDWGTQFGMLIAHMVEMEQTGNSEMALSDLEEFYRNAKKRFDESPEFADIARDYGVHLAIVPGGTLARKRIMEIRPKAVLAIACERDLTSGIRDAFPVPVFGVLNSRPFGPCVNTQVDMNLVKQALNQLLIKEKID